MNSTLSLKFGKSQVYTSERMKKSPALSKLINAVFGYTNVGNWARSLIVINLFKQLPLRQFKKVLDLGAGLGEFSFMLSDALPNIQITALEIAPDRVAALHRAKAVGNYDNVSVFSDKIEQLPEEGTYDFIFSVDVFEHIYAHEMPFSACYSKLKPGGYLMVKMPNVKQSTILPDRLFEEHNHWLDDEHIGQVYDLADLTNRFTAEGFTIVHSSYSDGWFSRLGWEIGYFAKKGGSASQLLFLPLCKFLVHLDRFLFKTFLKSAKSGNAIQVIGKK